MRTLTCFVVLGSLVLAADPPRKTSEDGQGKSQMPAADTVTGSPAEARTALTPADAVKAGAKKVVTIEFGVGSATFLNDDQRAYGSGPVPTVVLQWDGSLTDGGSVFVLVTGTAVSWHVQQAKGGARADSDPPYPSLRELEEFSKQIKGRGIRVTGRLQSINLPGSVNYQLVLDDPENFKIIK